MKPLILKIVICLVAASGVYGCSTLTPGPRDAQPIVLPASFSLYTEKEPGPGNWWQAFGSLELNTLVDQALSDNFDVLTAASKVRQAEAEARKAGADLFPTLDYDGSGETNRQQTKTDADGTSTSHSKSFSAGLSAGYEVDLWGRLKALKNVNLREYQATREDLDAAAATVAGDVVTAWIDILSVRRQIAVLKDQIVLNHKILTLQEVRFMNGQADALDVSQQRQALAEVNALLPPLQLEEETGLNALVVLLGKADTSGITISKADLPHLIALPGTGLPADLLAARPDIRAAGLRLNEMDWQVSAARADRLPSLTLSADAVFSAGTLDFLFSNWITTLAASVTGPLFDAGYRSAEVDRAKAEADQYLTAYAQTVAQAVQEVQDCLVTEKRQTEYIDRLNEQLAASRTTVKDAHLQYMNGQDNYLSYLSAWLTAQALERQLVSEQAARVKNRVALYRALGGDWTRNLSSTLPAATDLTAN